MTMRKVLLDQLYYDLEALEADLKDASCGYERYVMRRMVSIRNEIREVRARIADLEKETV